MSYPITGKYKVDRVKFLDKLIQETELLKQWFEEKNFTRNCLQIGSEVEYFLIDNEMRLSSNSDEIIKKINGNVVQEIDNCFLECNTEPVNLTSSAFHDLQHNIETDYRSCSEVAENLNTHMLGIGNCPTATIHDFERDTLTKNVRYKMIQKALWQSEHPFTVEVSKRHGVELHCNTVSELSASFQIHLRVGINNAVKYYNTAIALAGPILAVCTNSPLFCGKQIWMDSRILYLEKLFKAVKPNDPNCWSRVAFPHRYISDSWYEIYSENFEHYPVVMPIVFEEPRNPIQHVQLHNGCRYPWIRTIIDFTGQEKPHLRIEFRPLSSGPTSVDMVANAALFVGLVNGFIKNEMDLIPHSYAKENFYHAAQYGLDAKMKWKNNKLLSVSDLFMDQLLPIAKEGLETCGISQQDAENYLNIISQRILNHQNGSTWQIAYLANNGGDLQNLVEQYIRMQNRGAPVHEWGI